LYEIVDDRFVPVIDAKFLNGAKVEQVLEPIPGEVLLLTKERGIFKLRDHTIEPFTTEADSVFRNRSIWTGKALPNGLFVVALQRRGLVLLEPSGHLHGTFSEENGLPEPTLLNWGSTSQGESGSAVTAASHFPGRFRSSMPDWLDDSLVDLVRTRVVV
jgi:hypothetical protein